MPARLSTSLPDRAKAIADRRLLALPGSSITCFISDVSGQACLSETRDNRWDGPFLQDAAWFLRSHVFV